MNESSGHNGKLFTAVLAAGESRRFGRSKQLEIVGGIPLVTRAMRVAERVSGPRSLLVAGNNWQDIADACSPLRGYLVYNDDYRSGMASSIVAAVRALPTGAGGLLVLLADQPKIDERVLEPLVSRWEGAPTTIVCSRSAAGISPPVIFPAGLFDELAGLEGDRGARAVIERHRDITVEVEVPEAAVDIDTPGDLDPVGRD